jgi:hypothetical protein
MSLEIAFAGEEYLALITLMTLFSKVKRVLSNVMGEILLSLRIETIAAQLALDKGRLEARLRYTTHGIAHSVHYSIAGVGSRTSWITCSVVPSMIAMMDPELLRDSCAIQYG